MKNIIVFDLETTGLELWKSRIVQMSFMKGDKIKTILVNPQIQIPEAASRIHKITDDVVKDEKPFSHYAEWVWNTLNNSDGLMGFNIRQFDLPILNQELLRCGYEIPDKPIIDVLDHVKLFEPDRKLSSVYLRYFGESLKGAHSADVDVKATLRILEYIQSKLK